MPLENAICAYQPENALIIGSGQQSETAGGLAPVICELPVWRAKTASERVQDAIKRDDLRIPEYGVKMPLPKDFCGFGVI